ncbi:MAG: hypothetical protein MRZ37_05685 [Tenericutes bacterium]|nr:hypothetical protein [Mycoplasmatota bacterium]
MKKDKLKRIMLLTLFILLIILVLVIYFKFFKKEQKEIKENKVVDTIKNYDYHLKEEDSKLTSTLFNELDKVLSDEEINEEEYAKLISQLFVIDFYTLNNKLSNTDIGGIQYIHPDIKDNFIIKAENTVYKYVKSNIYGNRTQELPIITNTIIEDIKVTDYTSKTYKDNNSYQIKIKVEYQKDLKYPTEIELKLIHKDKKLYIIEVK